MKTYVHSWQDETGFFLDGEIFQTNLYRESQNIFYRIFRPIRCTVIFSLGILEKNNDECILILVIYWKKTGLLHAKISKHNIIYSL